MGRVRILDFRFWIKELKFNPKSSIPSPKGRRYANGLVQFTSPKSKIELPNAQCPMPNDK
ncbi:MAG: hypothetical protein V7K31_07485 [Nostoc sp.]